MRALKVLCPGLFSFALMASSFQPGPLDRLRAVVERSIEASSGEMGVAIKHVETGAELAINGDRAFPMASTFKVPILVEFFNQVDEGKIRLHDMVSLGPLDPHLGSGQLKDYVVPGISLSMENLAVLMMRISDNTATDLLLDRVGISNVNHRLATLGITGISVNRSTQDLIMDQMGFQDWNTEGMTHEEILAKLNDYQVSRGELEMAAVRFDVDPQDTATPIAMNQLLEKILLGQAASPPASSRIVEIMLQCETGRDRLPGFLPDEVPVAHKTGTIGGTLNDVGILFLPEGRGHVLISVLSRGSEDADKTARAIADIGRYAYDYFLFTAPESLEDDRDAPSPILSVP